MINAIARDSSNADQFTGENVQLVIDNKSFHGWTDIEIKLSLDSFSTVSFSAPFEPDRAEFRQIFEPFTFKPVQGLVGGDIVFTGTMIGVNPQVEPNARTIEVSAYSVPGVLGDCTSPSGFGRRGRRSGTGPIPRQFGGYTLQAIATKLCEPFGIKVTFLDPPGAPFASVAIKIEEKIHSFLVELAKQRGLVITNDATGGLIFQKSVVDGSSVVTFIEGHAPLTTVRPTFSPQEYYSEITGYAPAKHRKPGSQYTLQNKWLGDGVDDESTPINAHRPMCCKFDDTEVGDAPDATMAKMGRMFGNMVSYEIEGLPTWRDPQGKLWTPNTLLKLTAPGAMIYKETVLLVRGVTLKQNANAETASLNLVLPNAFGGQMPTRLPWRDEQPAYQV
jgi:prophage tail gpP-like protein